MRAYIHTPRNRVRPSPMSRCVQITPTMRTQYRCVPLYTLPACAHIRYMIEPAHSRGPAFLVPCTSTSHVNNTPLPPPNLRVFPSPRHNKNWDPYPLDVISVTSSSDFSPPPPSVQCAQEKDTHDTVHGARPCTVPPTQRATASTSAQAQVPQCPVAAHDDCGGTHARSL